MAKPVISVIVLNYNGERWLKRCLESLHAQTIFAKVEVLLADNASPDRSDLLAAELMKGWSNGRVIQHGANLGFCEGNNRAASQATGTWLFFLNNDTWLEPDCLERLLAGATALHADAATPLVLNYGDQEFQSLGATGFDIFGIATARNRFEETREIFMPEGCSYLIRRELFDTLGGFDPEFFMFADETDLSWRVWISGHRCVGVPSARLHHRGAANVNPAGGGTVAEFRTSDTKRFYANRNGMLVLFQNARNVLLLLLLLQVLLLFAESLVALLLIRRWGFVKKAFYEAVGDCWRLRHHILAQRRKLSKLRRRSDWWMLRFLKLRPNRWDELARIRRHGLPKVGSS